MSSAPLNGRNLDSAKDPSEMNSYKLTNRLHKMCTYFLCSYFFSRFTKFLMLFFGRKQGHSKIKKSGNVPKQCHFPRRSSIVGVIYSHEFMPIIKCFMPKSKANYFYSIYKNTVQPSFYPFTFLLICGNTQKLKSCNNKVTFFLFF